jgi:translation initiation factor IF-3
VPQVRVIGHDGAQLGVLDTPAAIRAAEEVGLDLVEVSPKAVPPVCKIMDYGKFKYEDAKKRKEARKHQSTVTIKEVKFRPKTDDHDFEFKVKHIRRFLGEGNKAKLVVNFRGREIVHPETGEDVLRRVVEVTQDVAMVEQMPLMEGRRMIMVIGPRGGVIRPAGAPIGPGSPGGPSPHAPRPQSFAPQGGPRPQSAGPQGGPRPHSAPPGGPRPQGPSGAPRPSPQVVHKPGPK